MDELIRTLMLVAAYLAGATGLVLVIARFVPAGRDLVHRAIGGQELWFAWACALGMTAASLTLSEVFHYQPCRWCWFQRIAAYPLTIVLGWAAFRRDRGGWAPALTLAGLGITFSSWHIALDLGWVTDVGACDVSVPCTGRWAGFENGWSTIQVGAFCCFLFIIGLGLHALARRDDATLDDSILDDPTTAEA